MKIEAIANRILTAINPEHGAKPPAKWQQRKSAQTRERLLEAGIDCLVEHGYSGLTTAAVAQRCGISRGAMHHHFAARLDLVSAVVEEVFYRRMRAFLKDYFDAIADRDESLQIELACEAHWRSVHTREYAAYLELTVAARCDAALAKQFIPTARRYDAIWNREMADAFPQWEAHRDAMRLVSDLMQVSQMGLLLHEPVFEREARIEPIRMLLTSMVKLIHEQGAVQSEAKMDGTGARPDAHGIVSNEA